MKSVIPGMGINVTSDDLTEELADELVARICELRCEWVRFEFDFAGSVDERAQEKFLRLCAAKKIKILGLLTSAVHGKLINILFPEFSHVSPFDQSEAFLLFIKKDCKKVSP